MKEFERFVAELQLYGTPKQVELMGRIVTALSEGQKEISFDRLLEDLRDVLRGQLRMEPVPQPIWWYRFQLPEWKRKVEENSAQEQK